MPAPVPARITYGDPTSLLALAAAVGSAQGRQGYGGAVQSRTNINDPILPFGAPGVPQGQSATPTGVSIVRNPLRDELTAANERHRAALSALQNAPGTGSSSATFGAGGQATESGGDAAGAGRNQVTVTRSFPTQPNAATPLARSKQEYVTQRGLDPANYQNIIGDDTIDFTQAVRAVENAVPKPGKTQEIGNLTDVQRSQIQGIDAELRRVESQAALVERQLREAGKDPTRGESQYTTPGVDGWITNTPAKTDERLLSLQRAWQQTQDARQRLTTQRSQLLQGRADGMTSPAARPSSPEQQLLDAMRALQ